MKQATGTQRHGVVRAEGRGILLYLLNAGKTGEGGITED